MELFEFIDTESDRLLASIASCTEAAGTDGAAQAARALLEELATFSLSIEDVAYGAAVAVGLDISVQVLMAHAFLNQCISRASRDPEADVHALADLEARLKAYVALLRELLYPKIGGALSANERSLVAEEIHRRLSRRHGSNAVSRLSRPGYAYCSLQRLAASSKRRRVPAPRDVPTLHSVVEDFVDTAPITPHRRSGVPAWPVFASALSRAGETRSTHR